MATRQGSAEWKGDLKGGSGELVVGDGVFTGAYSFKSRFEEGEGTNPEELIGAAHAACFSMALSSIARGARPHARFGEAPPPRCTCEPATPDRRSNRIDLKTVGAVPGIDQEHFAQHAEEAKAGCLVSRALAGVGEITVEATLA